MESRPRNRSVRAARWTRAPLLLLGLAVAPAGAARADTPAEDSAAAETLFVEARSLMKEQRYALACAKFRESNRLDPGIGVRLHLANCYEKNGQIASAWVTYRDVAEVARRLHDARAADAETHAGALAPRVSRLTIAVPPGAQIDGLRIARSGVELSPLLWGSAIPVDGATYVVRAEAPGYAHWQTSAAVAAEGEQKVVVVPPLVSLTAPSATPAARSTPVPDASAPPQPSRTAAFVLAGAGVAAIATGAVFGIRTFAIKSERDEHCDATTCDPRGLELDDDARTSAAVSTVALGAGVLASGISAWLFLRAGKAPRAQALQGKFGATPRGGSVVLEYRW